MKTLAIGIFAFGTLAVGMGSVDHFIVYLLFMAIYGIALTMVQTVFTTLIQENAVPDMHGRIFGLYGARFSGFLPLGMLVFGPLADAVSIRLLMVISGIMLVVMAAAIMLNKRFYLHSPARSIRSDA